MVGQKVLCLQRRHPDAANLGQIRGATQVVEPLVRIHPQDIICAIPAVLKRGFCCIGIAKIGGRDGIAAHPCNASLPDTGQIAPAVADFYFKARHDLADVGCRALSPWGGKRERQDLGRAQPVLNPDPAQLFPCVDDKGRLRLAGGNAQTQRRQITGGTLDQDAIDGRHREKNRCPMLFDLIKDGVRVEFPAAKQQGGTVVKRRHGDRKPIGITKL